MGRNHEMIMNEAMNKEEDCDKIYVKDVITKTSNDRNENNDDRICNVASRMVSIDIRNPNNDNFNNYVAVDDNSTANNSNESSALLTDPTPSIEDSINTNNGQIEEHINDNYDNNKETEEQSNDINQKPQLPTIRKKKC